MGLSPENFFREQNCGVVHGFRASQVALLVKNPTANAGDMRDSGSILGWGTSLEEGMPTQSSILAWRTPWTEDLGRL